MIGIESKPWHSNIFSMDSRVIIIHRAMDDLLRQCRQHAVGLCVIVKGIS